jgi:DNA-binding NtrC family response regulator
MSARQILIVEDRESLRGFLRRALTLEGYEVTEAEAVKPARQILGGRRFDLVLTDLMLPDGDGLEVLAQSRELHPEVPVIVLTGHGTVERAVEAMKLGAADFLEKPLEIHRLTDLVKTHLVADPESIAFQAEGAPAIVGRHPLLAAALRLLEKVAPTESTVLLTGESGTGKELFARNLHALSKRSGGPFVAVNCAAIPATLMENELFGHEKGAFTGASRRQAGRFELARGGTLFLDEIGELEIGVQSKVLRVLEERTFERVGGGRTQEADVRVVAATNRDLETMSRNGEFRQDLFYRLNVFPIELPSLRRRASDIPFLARHLLARLAERLGQPAPEIPADALEILEKQEWPGNVRQLANVLERGIILTESGRLGRADLLTLLGLPDGAAPEEDEESALRRALEATDGDKRQAAERLGISYRTLQRRVRRYDLEGFPKYRS